MRQRSAKLWLNSRDLLDRRVQCLYCRCVECICHSLQPDDYDLDEFLSLHVMSSRDVNRRSTNEVERRSLENVFAQSQFPVAADIAFLCHQLRWNRGRVMRWISNKRAFPNRAGRQKQSTSDSQRALLQEIFQNNKGLFEGDQRSKLGKVVFQELSRILGWSSDRLVRWFRNQRNYKRRKLIFSR